MSDVVLLGRQIGYEQRSYWRNPAAAIFTFAFPVMLFIIFGAIFGNQNYGTDAHPIRAVSYYTPSILAFAVLSAGFLSIAMQYVQRREVGLFKRLRGTPLPAWALIGGTIGSTLVVAFLQSVVTLTLARVAYHVSFPAVHLLAMVVTVLVATVSFCALGIAVSSFIPNDDAAPAVVNLPYFLLVFISGTYFPVSGTLARIAGYFPLRPFFQAMQHAVSTPGSVSGFAGRDLLRIAVWGVIGAVVAARRFQWSPHRH